MNLWELGHEADALLAQIGELLETNGGNAESCDVQEAIASFFQNDENLGAKLDGYAALIREREARAHALREEADRLERQADVAANLAKSLKKRLLEWMQTREQKKLETARYTLSVVGNGKAPMVMDEFFEVEWIPERLRRMKWEPDKEAIRAALEAGEEVPGVTLGQRAQRLSIR